MLNNIKTNQLLIDNGVWMPLLQSRFLIASVESKRFKQAIIDNGQKALTEDVLIGIMAKTILLDWSMVKDPQGNDLAYSNDMAAIALKTNESVKSFVDRISTSIGLYCEQK